MGPLENIKVVELATYLAAPTCARVLADWGADVIKVEPLKGDIYRTMGPTQMCPITEKANPTFDNHNSGKKYVALNLRSAEGMEAFHRLLAQADVFVTNNRPDALEAMHLTYDDLKDKYPRLIFAHVLGYGEKGPDYNKPGFDYTAFFSRSGILADLAPAGGPPCNIVTGMGDHAVSISLAAGICAALYHRTTTGLGEKVDCGLLQVGCFLLQAPIQSGYYGKVMPRTRYDPNQANSNTYQCSDGEWIFLAATDYNRQFPKLCKEVFNRPDLLEDPRFNDRLSSIKNKAELVKVYDEIFKTKRTSGASCWRRPTSPTSGSSTSRTCPPIPRSWPTTTCTNTPTRTAPRPCSPTPRSTSAASTTSITACGPPGLSAATMTRSSRASATPRRTWPPCARPGPSAERRPPKKGERSVVYVGH